ncbi:GNAT family N-acetyltransferase [soil metagenome]
MILVRRIEASDRPWVIGALETSFGDVTVARKGGLIDASVLPGFIASERARFLGFLSYHVTDLECEIVVLVSFEQGRGAGRALMDAIRLHASEVGCSRLWLITTNDNTRALRFYQRWGMNLCAFHRWGVHRSRQDLKPGIPERGDDGIPLDHELELELLLHPR